MRRWRWQIAELTAIFNYNGMLANAMGLIPNSEYHELGRQPDPETSRG